MGAKNEFREINLRTVLQLKYNCIFVFRWNNSVIYQMSIETKCIAS